MKQMVPRFLITDVLESFILDGTISSIDLSRFGCSVGSFASKPYFVLILRMKNQEKI